MRRLRQQITALRALGRGAAARVGVADPRLVRPARLVLRLGSADLPGSPQDGPTLTPHVMRQRVAQAVRWLGPLPVTVLAPGDCDLDLAADLVRFAHRLECPTTLVTDGVGLDAVAAVRLVDAGLQRVVLRIGGATAAVHAAVVGGDLRAARGAWRALADAAEDRGRTLTRQVALPWRGHAPTEAAAVFAWASSVGAEQVVLEPAFVGTDAATADALPMLLERAPLPVRAPAAELLSALAQESGEAPGVAASDAGVHGRLPCPVAGQRLELSRAGALSCCPFHAPIPLADDVELRDAWADSGAHLQAIRGCGRRCLHPELAPAPPAQASRGLARAWPDPTETA